jgi:hypothetical protein
VSDLDDFTTPIGSLLSPTGRGRLSKKRTEELSTALAGLRDARRRAWTELCAAHPTEEGTTHG